MPSVQPANIIALLKRIHLFYGISDDLLTQIAEEFQVEYYAEGGQIFGAGDDADYFYIVYRGTVSIRRRRGQRKTSLLEKGDYFGHEAIVKRHFRRKEAAAKAGAILLRLPYKTFLSLYNTSTHFKKSIRLRMVSDEIVQHHAFDWLNEDETVYLAAIKHAFFLYQALVGPFFILALSLALIALGWISGSVIPTAVGGLGILAAFVWGAWQWIDWSNDYYLITNQRVVWIEKVLFLYDSRVESPFSMINSSDAHTDFLGRLFDYGDVIIKTYTTQILFRHTASPTQIAALIDELRGRTVQNIQLSEEQAMTEAIKRHLGLTPPPRPKVDEPQEEEKKESGPLALPNAVLASLFQLRTINGDAIVYRKHWFILIQEAWMPTLFILMTLLLLALDLLLNTPEHGMWTYFVLLVTALIGLSGWWAWQAIDWRNDYYQLTSEQIMDVDKKPLGHIEQKTAKLEDILSIEYRREGLPGLILNFGTVYIKVGTEVFTFDSVHNPAGVQQEIQQRRQERLLAVKENKLQAERDRMAKWMAIYHKSAQEIARLEAEKNDKIPPQKG